MNNQTMFDVVRTEFQHVDRCGVSVAVNVYQQRDAGGGIFRFPARSGFREPSLYQSDIAPNLWQSAAEIKRFLWSHTAPSFLQTFETIKSDKIQLGKFPGLVVNHSTFVYPKLQYEFAGRKSSLCLLDRKSQTVKPIQKRVRTLHIFFGVIEGVHDGIM